MLIFDRYAHLNNVNNSCYIKCHPLTLSQESSVSYFITKSLSSRTGEPLSPVFTINRQSGVISKTEDDPSEDGYLLEVTAVDESSSTEEPRISKTTVRN